MDQWIRKGLACTKSGNELLFNSAAVVAFLESQAEARAVANNRPADADEARARKLSAEAELAEMERDERRGELVPIAAVERVVVEEYTALRAKLLSLPSKLAPQVAIESGEAACRELLERGITEALDELSRDAREVVGGAEDGAAAGPGGGAEAAAEADGQRVG